MVTELWFDQAKVKIFIKSGRPLVFITAKSFVFRYWSHVT